MARLFDRTHTRVINTLSAVHEEIAGTPALREPSEPREPTPTPATVVPDVEADTDASTASRPPLPPRASVGEPATTAAVSSILPDDNGGIQINEVSSSSPTEGAPKPRSRRPRTDAKRDTPGAAPGPCAALAPRGRDPAAPAHAPSHASATSPSLDLDFTFC
ncbi:hypothetical protein PYW07_009280 [Mythimna separata]|uniref:Uncharacterized protein n=1 Tax=Mythimna separata TaxID=271217 RepID=A0AAD7YBP7_MYTSE|nr:hypothetical protein PYW07_009280 [Mythimna separata]